MIEHPPALFELHPQPMWVVDPAACTVQAVNAAAIRRFGFTRDQFLGFSLADLRARPSVPSLLETWLCAHGHDPGPEPHPLGVAAFRSADGEYMQAEVSVSAIPWGGGDAVLCLLQDVTERARAEEATRRSQERFVALTRAVDGLIWEYNLVTGEVWRGAATREIFGMAPAEFAAHLGEWFERLHPDDFEATRASFEAAIEDPATTTWRAEYRFRGPGGRWLNIQDYAAIIRDSHGRAERMIGTMMDASGRRRAEKARAESEHRLRTLFESALVGIVFGDTDGTILEANDAFLRIVGYDRRDLEARRVNVREITPPEQIPITDRALDAVRQDVVPPYEKEYIRKDGTRVPVLVSLTSFHDRREGFALVLDLTEMKRAQRELIEHQNRLQALFDNTQDAIMLFNQHGYFVDANPAACRLLGYTHDEICRLHMYDMFPDEELARARDIRRAVLSSGRSQGEVRRRRRDGSFVEVEYRAVANITPGVHLTVLRDITQRKQSEAAQREAENRFRGVVESSIIGIGVWDAAGRILEANDPLLRIVGWTRAQFERDGLRAADILPADHGRALLAAETSPTEREFVRRDGTRVPVLVGGSAFAGRDDQGAFYVLDLTERRRAEQELAEHQRRLQALFTNSVDAIVMFDSLERFLDLNPAACEMFGYAREELIGRPFSIVLPPEEEAPVRRELARLSRDGRLSGAFRGARRDGGQFDVEARAVGNIVPGVHMAVLRDLRERRESERALRSLSGRLLQLQDEERRRLAREIHDSTAQGLAALSIGLGVIGKAAERLGAREQRALADAQNQVEQCARELRTISYLLHPPLLDEMGLASALRAFADGFANRSGIRITLQLPEIEGRLPRETETALFRIVQECLTNIHRHAGSPTAEVRLLIDAESVVLEVADRGHGMRLPASGLPASELGVGIVGMQERVRQLGGRLEFESGRSGTTVRAVLPRAQP